MNTISGIVFEKDTNTNKRYIRIFDQHGKTIMPFLEQIGVIDRNDDFWEEYTTAIIGDELRRQMDQRIDAWKWNEK
jgi:predicted transcriptional regulator